MIPATLKWEPTVVPDDPDAQVAATIELMSGYVRSDAHTPEVLAEAATAAPPGTDPLYGVFHHVKGLIRFQQDEKTAAPLESRIAAAGYDYPVVEVLIRPLDMVTWRKDTGMGQVGDCDDYAMLTAALLRAHGIRSNFVTVAADRSNPGVYSHVYVSAHPGLRGGVYGESCSCLESIFGRCDDTRVAMDTSHGAYPGDEVGAERATRLTEWPIDAGLRGLLMAGVIVTILLSGYWKRKGRTL